MDVDFAYDDQGVPDTHVGDGAWGDVDGFGFESGGVDSFSAFGGVDLHAAPSRGGLEFPSYATWDEVPVAHDGTVVGEPGVLFGDFDLYESAPGLDGPAIEEPVEGPEVAQGFAEDTGASLGRYTYRHR
jgi:hypothetical protein